MDLEYNIIVQIFAQTNTTRAESHNHLKLSLQKQPKTLQNSKSKL